MKKVINFFEFIDQFDFPISFHYKKDDSYSTCLGGLVTLVIVLLGLSFGIYYSVPFFQRKNYSLYYYTINLNQTEEINLYKSKAALAFKFDCKKDNHFIDYGNLTTNDFIELRATYIYYSPNDTNESYSQDNVTNTEEKNIKKNIPIGIHPCEISDFYNNRNLIKSIEKNLSSLMCLDDLSRVIKNRHQDKRDNFTYYQIEIKAKNDSDPSNARQYLFDYDCKVELHYVDVKIEVDLYKDPIKPFLNKVFLQLIPDSLVKMDTYFMNEYFESINDLFFPTKGIDKINNLFSRTEQYFLYKGIDSKEESIAVIYIRADTRKMEIKRKYQTVLEFISDTFAFWDLVFLICKVIFNAYNRTSITYFLENELFFFKGEKNKYLNASSYSNRKIARNLTNIIGPFIIPEYKKISRRL